ncbi:MAG: hypothetical protein DLM73_06630 [Chthoniobacterales bacterium]|nr:MAG: hypothetical protein DLM73_06630 [Chthoniobacterales bacterium]
MKIHLRQIQADGLHLEGEEDCPIQDLEKEDVSCTGPLRYSLDVGISEGALWASGRLVQPVELKCVRCLEPFPFDIEVKAFSLHLELTGPELIDLTPYLREDILLNLPAHPHCDREGGRVCPAPAEMGAGVPAAEKEEKAQPDWSALDKLKL